MSASLLYLVYCPASREAANPVKLGYVLRSRSNHCRSAGHVVTAGSPDPGRGAELSQF